MPSSPQPTCSARAQTNSPLTDTNGVDENLELLVKDEASEIARLQLPASDRVVEEDLNTTSSSTLVDNERIPKIEFHCSACGLVEMVHYFGQTPEFVYGLKFREPTYVMRDPFQPPPRRWKPKAEYFVALGANCHNCQRMVCKDIECSFCYIYTYCLPCAEHNFTSFPPEVQQKLRKQQAIK